MSKLYTSFEKPLSNFNLISKKYKKINWEEAKISELVKLLKSINVDFEINDNWTDVETVEYLKQLLESEKQEAEITPEIISQKIISKIEALRQIYLDIGGKNDKMIESKINVSISNLEKHLEEIRQSRIEQEKIKKTEKLEAENSELDDSTLDEDEDLEDEDLEDEDLEDEDLEDEDLEDEDLEDEDIESDDKEINYSEDNSESNLENNGSNRSSVIDRNSNSSSKNTIQKINKRVINKHNVTHTTNNVINNSPLSDNYNDNWNNHSENYENNSQNINFLIERIDQLESIINSQDKVDKGIRHLDNLEIEGSEINESTLNLSALEEFSNSEVNFDNLDSNEIEFKNSELEMPSSDKESISFKNSNNEFGNNLGSSNNEDQTRKIDELITRISSLENNKNIEKENQELKKDLELIKKQISKIEKYEISGNKKYSHNSMKNNRPKIIKTIQKIYKQAPKSSHSKTVLNNNTTKIIHQKLTQSEIEKLKRDALGNPSSQKRDFNTNSGSTMSPLELEKMVLDLSKKLKENQMSGGIQNSFDISQTTDPFAGISSGGNSDPFAGISSGGNSDPFAGISSGGNSDPFAGISSGGNSDPFAGISSGGNSDPFAGISSGGNSDPFAGISSGGNSDPFAGISTNNFNTNNKSNIDVKNLQKQIKELQRIVLGNQGKKYKRNRK